MFAVRKILLVVVLFLLSGCSKEDESESVTKVSTSVKTFSATFSKTYDHPELNYVEEVAIELVSKVPGIGDAISSLSESLKSEKDLQILNSLQELKTNLNSLAIQLDEVKKIVSAIPQIIQISILQKQVAEDGREIQNCYNNYLLFLDNPHSTVFRYRIIECYGKMQYLRELGEILSGKVITFDQQSLFNEVISKSGTCNGTEITSVFKYIFGLYLKGCVSISMAESLKFSPATPVSVSEECKNKTFSIFTNLRNVYLQCQNKNTCDNNEDADRMYYIIGENTNLKYIAKVLKTEFPWYFFTLMTTEKEIEGNITGKGIIPSMMILKIREQKYVTVIWFPEKSNSSLNDLDSSFYHLELHQLYQSENGLDLMFSSSSDYSKLATMISGRVVINDKLTQNFTSCRYSKLYVPKTTSVAGKEDEELSFLEKIKKLALWKQILYGSCVAVGIIILPIIISKCYKKFCSRNSQESAF